MVRCNITFCVIAIALFLVAAISCISVPSSSSSWPGEAKQLKVIPGTGIFTDGTSTFIFHGMNFVYKGSHELRLNQTHIDFMVSRGFNAVRLGILWTNIEPTPGNYNTTYINVIREDVDLLWSYGIRTLLDMHQDCYSSMFCGGYDSLPDFVSHPPSTPEYLAGGSKAFPLPMTKPKYSAVPEPDNPWGRISNCDEVAKGPLGWASCYATHALGAATQRLYDNDEGSADRLAGFWAMIATVFKGHPGVVGYEIINEPWLGNVPLSMKDFLPIFNPKHWNLWYAGVADRENLAGLYDRVQAAIRSVDPDAVIFFEPATGGNILDATPVGFKSGPGGADYDTAGQNVLSYHIYCPWSERDMPVSNTTATSKIKRWLIDHSSHVCSPVNRVQYAIRHKDIRRLNVGGWLTEFGEVPQDHRAYPLLDFALTKMDEYLQSWTYWGDMDIKFENYTDIAHNVLVRPYPMMTWGTPLKLSYNNKTKVMSYTFKAPSHATEFNATTVYIPAAEFGIANKWRCDIQPNFTSYFNPSYNMMVFNPDPNWDVLGMEVTITVQPDNDESASML